MTKQGKAKLAKVTKHLDTALDMLTELPPDDFQEVIEAMGEKATVTLQEVETLLSVLEALCPE